MAFNSTKKNLKKFYRVSKGPKNYNNTTARSSKIAKRQCKDIQKVSPVLLLNQNITESEETNKILVINNHQKKSRLSNPNANISLNSKKKRRLIKRLQYAGLMAAASPMELSEVADAHDKDAIDFYTQKTINLSAILDVKPIEGDAGTVLGM